ncbi:transcription factor 20 isoform X2 [Lepisosteus oculatus]|uniref:transcription factor 20 isoform X2 n=1 Tax=Lepisosteus oculatus TaxID=7918 RepID=UPI0035F51DE1
MQTFRDGSAPAPAFPGPAGQAGGAGGPPYPPDALGSPRLVEDFVGAGGPLPHPQGALPQPGMGLHAGYGGRRGGGGAGEPGYPPGSGAAGSSSYRKEVAEYYYMASKEAQRRGQAAGGYGGFGYPALEGHPLGPQYRPAGPASGLLSHYQLDYSGAAFSPSQQYGVAQQANSQGAAGSSSSSSSSSSQLHLRQQAYPSHQPLLPQGGPPSSSSSSSSSSQQPPHPRGGYHLAGHRLGPQYTHYPPTPASGAAGSYGSPPQRYHSAAFDYGKVNSASSSSSSSSSSTSNSAGAAPLSGGPGGPGGAATPAGQYDSLGQGYPPGYGYLSQPSPQHHPHPLPHSHRPLPHPSPHPQGLGKMHLGAAASYPPPGKLPPQALPPSSSSSSVAPFAPQEASSQSPLQHQQGAPPPQQFHQNFSPISNPSPAASVVPSPSCSSSPSPLMGGAGGAGEGAGNSAGASRSSQGPGRPPAPLPQLSPTPSAGPVRREEAPALFRASALDGPPDKRPPDPGLSGLSALSALSSQVANLPNTVQHMLLSDTLLPHRRAKEAPPYPPAPPAPPPGLLSSGSSCSGASSTGPPRRGASRRPGAAEGGGGGGSSANSDGGSQADELLKSPQSLGSPGAGERLRQLSGTSSGSESAGLPQAASARAQAAAHSPSRTEGGAGGPSRRAAPAQGAPPPAMQQQLSPSSSSSSASPSSTPALSNPPPPPPPPPPPSCSPPAPAPAPAPPGEEPEPSEPAPAAAPSDPREPRAEEDEDEAEEEEGGAAEGGEGERTPSRPPQTPSLLPRAAEEDEEEEGEYGQEGRRSVSGARSLKEQSSGVGVIVSVRSEPPEPRQEPPPPAPAAGTPSHAPRPQGRQAWAADPKMYSSDDTRGPPGDTTSHNGEGGVGYPLHYGPKTAPAASAGRLPASQKSPYGYPDAPPSGVGPRSSAGAMAGGYQGYHQPLPHYAAAGGGRKGPGARADKQPPPPPHQQQGPSLLQEVLQGYHLDRRYGRADPPPGPPHGPALSRPPQGVLASPDHPPTPAPTGKHYTAGPPSAAWGHSWADKKGAEPPGPKHINLADYSLARKAPEPPGPSAVQQLLLQDAEPLAGPASERRSVICDVSPSRRTTPERERAGPQASAGASVIQQSLSSSSSSSSSLQPEPGRAKDADRDRGRGVRDGAAGPPHVSKDREAHHQNRLSPGKDARAPAHHRGGPSADPIDVLRALSPGGGRSSSLAYPPPPHHHHHHHHHPPTSSSSSLSSSSRYPGYFPGVDSGGGPGFGLEQAVTAGGGGGGGGLGGHKMSPHSQHHSHHPPPPLHQPAPHKSQLYPHAPGVDSRGEWASQMHHGGRPAGHKDPVLMMSPGSGGHRHQHQSPQGPRAQPGLLSPGSQPPQSQQSSYYNMVKLWGMAQAGREVDSQGRRGSLASPPKRHAELEPSARGVAEEVVQSFRPLSAGASAGSPAAPGLGGQHQHPKAGSAGDANPLMMRRRVRSFISPIPAKRQHHDAPHHLQSPRPPPCAGYPASGPERPPPAPRGPLSGPAGLHAHPGPELDPLSASPEGPQLGGPGSAPAAPHAGSPSPSGKTKILPPRKGRGLKLEAIVQKITSPGVKKAAPANHSSAPLRGDEGAAAAAPGGPRNSCGGGAGFPSLGSGGGLPFLGQGLSLDEIMSYRGAEETGPAPPSAVPYPCGDGEPLERRGATGAGGEAGREARGLSGELGVADGGGGRDEARKGELRAPDLTLLGPLPPPPALARPAPSPSSCSSSSSALSDIQRFANTYQQLEPRRGEQGAAALLRQKLQEAGGLAGGPALEEFSGSPPAYGPPQPSQNQNVYQRLGEPHALGRPHPPPPTASPAGPQEPKPPESVVPKGYFPSGKKKGRPVGSVNKQKRAQAQAQAQTIPGAPPSAPAAPQAYLPPQNNTGNHKKGPDPAVPLAPAAPQLQEGGAAAEGPQQAEFRPRRQRQRKPLEPGADGVAVRQRRRRRRAASKAGNPETLGAVEAAGGESPGCGAAVRSGVWPEHRKPVFSPYIHVERGVQELGAVCTIVNAEEEDQRRRPGGGGALGPAGGALAALSSQSQGAQLHYLPHARREREREREQPAETREKPRAKPSASDSALQSSPTGKALPSSGYVLPGPPVTESGVVGLLLCCLCRKWANYKNLGDLYGPYYPPDYAARLPKNPPPLRQGQGPPRAGGVSARGGPGWEGSSVGEGEGAEVKLEDGSGAAPPAPDTEEGGEVAGGAPGSADDTQRAAAPPPHAPAAAAAVGNREHRKLTSHPRFKRRHRSSEELGKMGQPPAPAQPHGPPSAPEPEPLPLPLPELPLDPEELWVHEACIAWASGVFLVNGRLYGLQEALEGAREASCSHCEDPGSTLGCYSKGCTLRYHYLCAVETAR